MRRSLDPLTLIAEMSRSPELVMLSLFPASESVKKSDACIVAGWQPFGRGRRMIGRFVPNSLRALLRWLLARLFVFEISGLDRVPSGRYIVAANHPAWLETFALAAFMPSDGGLRFLASRAATVDIGWRRQILSLADVVLPLDIEGKEARPAIRAAVDQLQGGAAIGIFPEDLRVPTNPDGTLRPLRRGVAFLARASHSPVVPVGISDTRELWRGRTIRIRIGEPLAPPRERQEDEELLDRLSERIEELRPPSEPLPARRSWTWLSRLF